MINYKTEIRNEILNQSSDVNIIVEIVSENPHMLYNINIYPVKSNRTINIYLKTSVDSTIRNLIVNSLS